MFTQGMSAGKNQNPREAGEVENALRIINPQDSWFSKMLYYFKASFVK